MCCSSRASSVERASFRGMAKHAATHSGIALDLAPDVLEASLSSKRRQLVFKVLLFLRASRGQLRPRTGGGGRGKQSGPFVVVVVLRRPRPRPPPPPTRIPPPAPPVVSHRRRLSLLLGRLGMLQIETRIGRHGRFGQGPFQCGEARPREGIGCPRGSIKGRGRSGSRGGRRGGMGSAADGGRASPPDRRVWSCSRLTDSLW
jgi:hypothetical protein